jgi:ATP-dependent helicase HrpA
MAFEKVLFLGLPIIVKRRIRYASIDPSVSHDIFLKQGLALRQLNTSIEFWQHNEKFLIELEKLEEMTRSRHFVPDEQWLYEFYRSKIPVEIFSQIELEKWWRYLDPAIKNNLFLTEKHLEQVDSADCKQAYPTEFVWQDNRLKISYQFSPGAIDDGVSLMVPLLLLAQLPLAPFEWLVPGLLPEKVHALLKGLPKELRKELMPIADAARTCAQSLFIDAGEDFFISLSNVLKQKFSCLIDAKILQQIVLPDFLKFNFKIIDEGKVLATSRDLLDLKQELLSPAPMENLTKQTILYTTWPAESLPEQRKIQQQQLSLIKYPALEAQEGGVVIVMSDSVFLARQIHHWGVTKLLQLRCKAELAYIVKKLLRPKFRAGNSLKNFHEMTSIENYISRWPDFTDYFCYAVINMTFAEDFWHLRTASDFDLCVQTHQQDLVENAQALLDVVYAMVIQLVRIEQSNAVIDLSDLIFTGFLATVPWEWLERYPFYLTAIAESLERDDLFSKIKPYESAKKRYESVLHDELKGLACPKKLSLIVAHQPTIFFEPLACVRESLLRGYYLLQEFRMSLLAPKFKTVESVSLARLEKLF